MIRFIFVAATVILFLILSIPLMLVEFLIGKKTGIWHAESGRDPVCIPADP